MSKINLFKSPKDCCGCGACVNICPKSAIRTEPNEYGFAYPVIDDDKCIACSMCKQVCAFQNHKEANTPKAVYAAMSSDDEILSQSASGGIFATVAKSIIQQGGLVYGCSMEFKNDTLKPEHIRVDHLRDLKKLQGSKYVQSFTGVIYKDVKEDLENGKPVLFSGTPCQVDALKSYLGYKKYDNLLTMDLICHGVPSEFFFRDYIAQLEKKLGGKITDFKFRDKTVGWALNGRVFYKDVSGTEKSEIIPCRASSYYKLFLESKTYRENCYDCKYACANRPGDLTIGDYWGLQSEHPDYLMANGGVFDEKKGVSCIIVNTEKGEAKLQDFIGNLKIKKSDFEKASAENNQLKHPCIKSPDREKVLELYKNEGYAAVEKYFKKQIGYKDYLYVIWCRLPQKLRCFLKKIIK